MLTSRKAGLTPLPPQKKLWKNNFCYRKNKSSAFSLAPKNLCSTPNVEKN